MSLRRKLRLAGFDGGGSRAFSQLKIMKHIMHRINYDSSNTQETGMLPCNHFDLIGGSDTGGLIAIMLVKLRMSVDEAIAEFGFILDEVYTPTLAPEQRTHKLRGCMEAILAKRNLPLNLKLEDDKQDGRCLGFVIAALRLNVAHQVRLRTYPVRNDPSPDITLIDAALATCASSPEFLPVSCGPRYERQEYVGASTSLGASNPISHVISEAHLYFGKGFGVVSLLSLGSGYPGVFHLPPQANNDAIQRLALEMVRDCEQKAEAIQRQLGHLGIYFRFSVDQGMQKDNIAYTEDTGCISAQTESYMKLSDTISKLDGYLSCSRENANSLTLDHLNEFGGQKTGYKQAPMLVNHYIRRQEHWKRIVDGISSPVTSQTIMVIAGMAGCGKTQLVADISQEYNPETNPHFKYVFFVDGSSEISIQTDLNGYVRRAMGGNPQIGFTDTLGFLQDPANSPWLVIYDNVDRKLNIGPLLPVCNHGVIIMTTRNQLLHKIASKPHLYLELGVMSKAESVELILRCSGRHSPSQEERATATLIAKKLGKLPVALTQAGCYMSDTGCTCIQYLDLLTDHLAKLMREPSGDRQSQSTYAAFDLTYSLLSLTTRNFIHILSCLHFANFPVAVISHAAKHSFRYDPFPFVNRGPEFEAAIRLLEVTFLSNGAWSKLTLPEMTRDLRNYSLASFSCTPLTQLIRIHPLMREWAFDRIPLELKGVFKEAACRLVVCSTDAKYLCQYLPLHIDAFRLRSLPSHVSLNDHAAFGKILRVTHHSIYARETWMTIYTALRREHGPRHLHVATAALELAHRFGSTKLEEMEKFGREAISIRMALVGPRHPLTLEAKGNLSHTLSRQKNHDEALLLREEVLSELKAQQPADHPEVLKAMGSLARLHRYQRKFVEAETLERRILEEQATRLGETHLDTLDAMDRLAWTHYLQGSYGDAEVLQFKVLEGRKAQLGEMHAATLRAMSSLALSYFKQCRYSDAEPLQVKILQGRRKLLTYPHLDTLNAFENLASTYCRQGRHAEAEQLQLQEVEGRKSILGDLHLETVDAKERLAWTFYQQGSHLKAEVLQSEVLHNRKTQQGDTHWATLHSMGSLASIYYNERRYSDAEILQVQVLNARVIQRGEVHSYTVDAMSDLALTYYHQLRFSDAETLAVKVLAARQTQEGETHSATLDAICNLVSIYRHQRRHADAEPLLLRLLSGWREQRGESHPYTLHAMSSLGSVYHFLGCSSEAEALQAKVLRLRIALEGEESREVAACEADLALTYCHIGRLSQAKALAISAKRTRERLLGAENPYCRDTARLLELIERKQKDSRPWIDFSLPTAYGLAFFVVVMYITAIVA